MDRSAFQVRRAGPADLEALVATRVALFREVDRASAEAGGPAFQSACREVLARAMGEGVAAGWLLVSPDGAVQGATILLLYPRIPSPANLGSTEGYLLNVYVAPGWRGRGAAAALVEAALAEARRRRLARVRLHATAAGRGVYEKLGFRGRLDEMELVLQPAPG